MTAAYMLRVRSLDAVRPSVLSCVRSRWRVVQEMAGKCTGCGKRVTREAEIGGKWVEMRLKMYFFLAFYILVLYFFVTLHAK